MINQIIVLRLRLLYLPKLEFKKWHEALKFKKKRFDDTAICTAKSSCKRCKEVQNITKKILS